MLYSTVGTSLKMKVVVTGAAGFIGSRLTDTLLRNNCPIRISQLILVDSTKPAPRSDPRVNVVTVDLTAPGAADSLIEKNTDIFFHLAAIVSGHAEADFDVGFRVNFDATRALLEAARRKAPSLKFVFTSTCGVFGGKVPDVIDDTTAITPETSYGAAKAMCELLINDYSRKGFVDGRVVRLPTVSVRPGAANKAVTSFASGIVREPLHGVEAICPVPKDLQIWLTSPNAVVKNIIHAAVLPASAFGVWRGVNLPGITVTIEEMVDALALVAGKKVASLVRFEKDEVISRIVGSFPRNIDNSRALAMGFVVDSNYAEVIKAYICDDLNK